MREEHIFKYDFRTVFSAIENSARKEVFEKTGKEFDILKGVEYEHNNLKYTIEECCVEKGYIINIEEDSLTSYTLRIVLENMNIDKTKLIYENIFKSKSVIKTINYKISSFIFKKRIKKRYNGFIIFIENMIEEG